MRIEVDVLGPLRIAVDGVTVEPPVQVAPLLVALAVPAEPIRKLDLAREVLFLSPGSIDSRLSRLHRLLGVDVPVHRVPVARSGLVELDRGSVRVDADLFRVLVAEADAMVERGARAEALRVLLRADKLWRDGPCAWEGLGDQDGRTAFGQARDELLDRRRHVRTVAASLAQERPSALPLPRLVEWTRDGDAVPAVWNARIVRELDAGGQTAARAAISEWPAHEASERARRWAQLVVEEQPPPGCPSAPVVTATARRLAPPIGREHEFTELWRFTQRVAEGRGGLHLLVGGSGTGKTHLLGQLRQHAHEQLGLPSIAIDVEENTGLHRVLRHGLTPLWHDLLRRPDPPDEVLVRADEIAAFIGGPTLDEPKGVSGREPIAPAHHAAGLAGAVLRAVEQPVLLVLDNVHRATKELLDVMSLLGRDSLGVVGVVASLRPDGCWGRLRVDDDPAVTLLEPFDLPAAGRFLASIRGRPVDEREVQCLYRRAGGTPLALLNASDDVEIVATSRSAPSVTSTLARWLESRPPAVRRVLAVAAVLAEGTRFDLTLLEQVVDGERDALGALAVELDKGIEVHRVDGQAAFTHRAWQEAAYAAIEPHRRRALHQRVLELLARQLVHLSDPVELAACAAALAQHAGRAEGGGLATTIGLGALVRAADTLAPYETATAISLYERAREMARPDEELAILLRQARARRLAAEWDAAERDLRAAAELAQTLGDVVAEAEATLLMAHMSWDPVRWNGTLADRLDSLLARVPADELTLRARLQACLAGGTYEDGVTGAGPTSTTLAQAAASVVDQLEAGDAAEVLMWARKGLVDVEPPDRTLSMAVRMRQLARGSSYLTGNAILASLVDRIRLGDDERARRDSSAYRALAGATGSPVQGYIAATLDALWSIYDGQFDIAAEAVGVAERLGREFGGTTARQVVGGQRVVLARERGVMSPQLVAEIDAHRPMDGRIPLWNIGIIWLQADCGLSAPAGDRLRSIAAQTDDFRALPRGLHRIPALAFVAEALFRLELAGCATSDDRRTARRVSTLLAALPDRQVLLGWPVAHLGPTSRYVGLSAVVGGNVTCGLHHLHSALRQSASAPHRARILVDIAAVLEDFRPSVARRALDEGHRLADRIGMRALVNN